MKVVAQAVKSEPGRSEKEVFEVATSSSEELKLKPLIEDSSTERKHVALYPCDYANSVYRDTSIEINIPVNVSITLMPGAIVDYDTDFRIQEYDYSGPVQEAEDGSGNVIHPLADGTAVRYNAPNFTGHVENIADLNLASEWAFKQEFERSLWSVRDDDSAESFKPIPFDGVLEFRPGEKIDIVVDSFTNAEGDEGAFAEISHEPTSTGSGISNSGQQVIQSISVDSTGHVLDATSVEAALNAVGGDVINVNTNASNDTIINHDAISISGSPNNSGTTVLQSVNPYKPSVSVPQTGHIDSATAVDIVGGSNINVFDGPGGITIETEYTIQSTAPTSSQGSDGDVVLVVT